MEYLIIVAISLIGLSYYSRMARSLRIFWIFVLWFVSTLIIGLRYRVGIDTLNYMETFSIIPTLDNFSWNDFSRFRYEPLYTGLNIICKTLFGEFWSLQIICAAITNGCIFLFLKRYCENPYIAILIYLYVAFLYFSTEILRESIAIGIFLLNYQNLERKKWLRYYLISFLSIGFHYSAILTWFIPLANYLRLNFAYLVVLCSMVLIKPLFESMLQLQILTIIDRMELYIGGNALNMNYRLLLIIQNVIPGTFAYYFLRKKRQSIPFRNLFLLQVLFCAGSFAIPVVFQRFINYTQLFVIVLLSYTFWNKVITKKAKIFLIGIILLSQLPYYYSSSSMWIPYVSIIEPYKVPDREDMWLHQF